MGMGVVAFWWGWWVCLGCRWLLLAVLEWRPVVVRAVELVGWIAGPWMSCSEKVSRDS